MMKEREYNVTVHSITRFIIAMIAILLFSVTIILDYLPQPENEIIAMIQILAVFVSSFYFAHLIGMGKAKVVFTNEAIVHIWERRFILSREKNFKIPWNTVDNYVFQEDRTFDSFIVNLTNNTRYRLDRINVLPIKDDFKKLVYEFPKLSNEFKNGTDSNLEMNPVKEGESIYASTAFRWLFYFLSVGFLALLLDRMFNSDSETTWSSLGVIGSGLLFYGLMIKGQKKTTNANKS